MGTTPHSTSRTTWPSLWLLSGLLLLCFWLASCAAAQPAATPTSIPTAALAPTATIAPPSPTTVPAAVTEYWPTSGWRTSAPEAQGMDGAKLAEMYDGLKQKNIGLDSLLVIRNGYIVGESYFGTFNQDDTHELYSCTKSFISTLVGIAADQGLVRVDDSLQDLLPGRTFANPDPRKGNMKLENLLTMTSGLDWQEGDPAYTALYRSSDWVKYVMDERLVVDPGKQFNYCSGCSHLLSAILQTRTGMNTRDYAAKTLFHPLGISNLQWDTDSTGIPIGGWGLHLTPRDMAKLGYLYLHQGMWNGQQIVSPAWVKTATTRHVDTGGSLGYGYQWWVYSSYGAYTALGRFGQTIFVIPGMNLIVVTTATNTDHEAIYQLIEKYIVPAAKRL